MLLRVRGGSLYQKQPTFGSTTFTLHSCNSPLPTALQLAHSYNPESSGNKGTLLMYVVWRTLGG